MGKRFQLMAVADNADEANQYMERHDDAAVIADFGPLVFMANKYFGAKSETE
jgi:FPC/CPF motif-containing protein YcgG